MRYQSQALVIITLMLSAVPVWAQEKVEADKPAAADAGRLADQAAKAKLVVDMYSDDSPAYVPGGKYVVFTSTRSGLSQLYRTSLDKPNDPPLRLTRSNERVMAEAIPLADGKSVIYLQDEDANERWSIFRIGIDGGEPAPFQMCEKRFALSMSSTSSVNLSLTYMALTARAADYAVTQLKANNIL